MITLVCINPARNQNKFYKLDIVASTEIADKFQVVTSWGRIGSAGRTQTGNSKAFGWATRELETLMQAKLRRGYSVQSREPHSYTQTARGPRVVSAPPSSIDIYQAVGVALSSLGDENTLSHLEEYINSVSGSLSSSEIEIFRSLISSGRARANATLVNSVVTAQPRTRTRRARIADQILSNVVPTPASSRVTDAQIQSILLSSKKPTTSHNHVGVEIEFISNSSNDVIARKLGARGLSSKVILKRDGSLRARGLGDYCAELCIVDTEENIYQTLATVGAIFAEIEAKVNSTCGLHVHLDMRNRDVKKSYTNLHTAQDMMFHMTPAARRRSQYCRKGPESDFDAASRSYYGRYRAINPQSFSTHKTLEIRLHKGSVDCTEIAQWVQFLVKIVSAQKPPQAYTNLSTFLESFEITEPSICQYIRQRVSKYAPIAEKVNLLR